MYIYDQSFRRLNRWNHVNTQKKKHFSSRVEIFLFYSTFEWSFGSPSFDAGTLVILWGRHSSWCCLMQCSSCCLIFISTTWDSSSHSTPIHIQLTNSPSSSFQQALFLCKLTFISCGLYLSGIAPAHCIIIICIITLYVMFVHMYTISDHSSLRRARCSGNQDGYSVVYELITIITI